MQTSRPKCNRIWSNCSTIRPHLVKIRPYLVQKLSILALELGDFPRRAQLVCNEMQGYDDDDDGDDEDEDEDDDDVDDYYYHYYYHDDDYSDVNHWSMQSGVW